jgi:hypothetical protein
MAEVPISTGRDSCEVQELPLKSSRLHTIFEGSYFNAFSLLLARMRLLCSDRPLNAINSDSTALRLAVLTVAGRAVPGVAR